jgi:hypothetical protein
MDKQVYYTEHDIVDSSYARSCHCSQWVCSRYVSFSFGKPWHEECSALMIYGNSHNATIHRKRRQKNINSNLCELLLSPILSFPDVDLPRLEDVLSRCEHGLDISLV